MARHCSDVPDLRGERQEVVDGVEAGVGQHLGLRLQSWASLGSLQCWRPWRPALQESALCALCDGLASDQPASCGIAPHTACKGLVSACQKHKRWNGKEVEASAASPPGLHHLNRQLARLTEAGTIVDVSLPLRKLLLAVGHERLNVKVSQGKEWHVIENGSGKIKRDRHGAGTCVFKMTSNSNQLLALAGLDGPPQPKMPHPRMYPNIYGICDWTLALDGTPISPTWQEKELGIVHEGKQSKSAYSRWAWA